ncbi:imidazole glycerol phosphate synthase subunit HisH [Bythopirellula goksoeyrii]|uniref:Imidazole glycerol phosphate synthase subunit HisH n=1 Tax=Bythopirellula goksoeyrii TaxID=1400387 RepID=A0A5B9QI99_9BACT|nr:imidazole glycerol phosphate synthase subunit HisH [Bythopirellula goksoeyrii]QEG36736.1 Imidazole glycerol phosphate synthase subunit HisH 1 [Bythopirellula goksoeyrii]
MIAIIDYQMGNLRSVQKGFERVGHAAAITSDPAILAKASHIVLPGVGAFADAIAELKRRELVGPIREAIQSGKPFLGICLGLQLLFEHSFEDGEHEGLGVLKGEVCKFQVPAQYKVPHMGWNEVSFRRKAPIFDGIAEETFFYFVHSYYVVPEDLEVVDGQASYPAPFCASIWRENLFATQFHPEKSQSEGLRVLSNFAELTLASCHSEGA